MAEQHLPITHSFHPKSANGLEGETACGVSVKRVNFSLTQASTERGTVIRIANGEKITCQGCVDALMLA